MKEHQEGGRLVARTLALRQEEISALFPKKAEQPAEAEWGRGTGGSKVSRLRSRRAS